MLGYVLSAQDVVEYYSIPQVQQAIFRAGQNRDTVTVMDTGILSRGRGNAPGFAQIEDIPRIAETCLRSQTSRVPRRYPSFHGTVGKHIHTQLFRRGRASHGADMVFDIDCKTNYRQAFGQAKRIVDYLEKQRVPYRIKFSGGTGPHIILPCEAFPESFLPERLKRLLQTVCERSGVDADGVDPALTSPKHFLRLVYSLNEYTGLVSLPLSREQLDDFEPAQAERSHISGADLTWFDVPADGRERMERFILDTLGKGNAA